MKIIDLHTHILPASWPNLKEKYGYCGWPRIESLSPCHAKIMIDDHFFREIYNNCWDPEVRLKNGGVDIQVLSTVPVMFSYWAQPQDTYDLSRYLNDHIAEIVYKWPNRFAGLGTIPMQAPELAIKELKRCTSELGLAGIQIGSHINDWNLDQAELFPIFQTAAELGAAIFVHPWDMIGKERMPQYFLPWLVGMPAESSLAICSVIFGGVLERLPNLKIGFAHGGGAFPFSLGRINKAYEARPDLCQVHITQPPRTYIPQIYVDSLVHDKDALLYLVNIFGANRIALGSDYPFPLGETEPGSLIKSMSEFNEATKEQLLWKTAAEFLGLEKFDIWD